MSDSETWMIVIIIAQGCCGKWMRPLCRFVSIYATHFLNTHNITGKEADTGEQHFEAAEATSKPRLGLEKVICRY